MSYWSPATTYGYTSWPVYRQGQTAYPTAMTYPSTSSPRVTATWNSYYYNYPTNNAYASSRQANPYAGYRYPHTYFTPPAQAVQRVNQDMAVQPWKNELKSLFHDRKAVTYALNLRTFAAEDKDNDGKIDPLKGESGTFLKAIPRLKELKELGVNNIHLLPILPIGKIDRLGKLNAPGSNYSPSAYDRLNEEFDEPGNRMNVLQEARMFIDAAHKEGIHVMVDIPSCASIDLANQLHDRPDIMAMTKNGAFLTPYYWVDIRMFVKDSPALRDLYQGFFDLMVDKLGVDGFRVDIARARTTDFWNHFISKYPDKAWLAETYTEEDDSPMENIPRDVPEDLLKVGFDSFYGQYHIFHDMSAPQYMQYLKQNREMFRRIGKEKSAIGSFLTHDDPSTMNHGGALYHKLVSGLMSVQPDTNPYILDGFTTGFPHHYDIFNWMPRPKGQHPEIGVFLKKMLELRSNSPYKDVFTVGGFIPLNVEQNSRDPKVVAFLRYHGGKTVLVLANKDINAQHRATIRIPGLKADQELTNLAPSYGESSSFRLSPDTLETNLGPGRFYVFDLDVPTLSKAMA